MTKQAASATALRRIASVALVFGIDLRRVYGLRHSLRFLRNVLEYRSKTPRDFPLRLRALQPILSDYDDWAGSTRDHYFHQDLWAARKIYAARPAEHVDVGSRIDGFVAHVLTFMPVTVIDVRPLGSRVGGLTFVRGDATRLDAFASESVASLSSLHAVEHFGLGRYGDPIAPDACFAAMHELARVLKPGGRLYFSVPVGAERLEFNAHRVFSPRTVRRTFASLQLLSFAAIDDAGIFREGVGPESVENALYACGMFEFTK